MKRHEALGTHLTFSSNRRLVLCKQHGLIEDFHQFDALLGAPRAHGFIQVERNINFN